MAQRIKRIFLKTIRVLAWTALSVLILLIILIALIRLPAVQQRITQQAVTFLEEKIGTTVRLQRAFISFPKKIVLEGLYLEDQSADTLVYLGELVVDANLWALTKNKIDLQRIRLSNFTGHVKRPANDSTFNFSYIIEAFAGSAQAEPVDTPASVPWQFALGDITLNNIALLYDDRYTGNFVNTKIGKLAVAMQELDPAKSIYKIKSVDLRNVTGKVEQRNTPTSSPAEPADTTAFPFDIGVEEITLKNISLAYSQLALKQHIMADLNYVYVDVNKMDLQQHVIDIDNIELNNSFISYNFYQPGQPADTLQKEAAPFTGLNIPWDVKVRDISLEDNRLQYYNTALPVQKGALDFNHLWIFGLQCSINDVAVRNNSASAVIESFSFQEKSNFALQEFELDFNLEEKSLAIDKLLVDLGKSKLELTGNAAFNSLAEYAKATVDLHVFPSEIAVRDILFFAPTLLDSVPVKLSPETTLSFNTKLKGTVNNLTLETFTASTLAQTSVNVQGNIKGLPDFDHAYMRLTLDKFYTTAADINSIATDSLIPASVQIPEWIELHAVLNGTINTPTLDALLKTSSGSVNANGSLDLTHTPQYAIQVQTQQLHLGKILRQPETMGVLNMRASAAGSGFALEEMNTTTDVVVSAFEYQGYTYKDFTVKGSVVKSFFSGEAFLHDENLDFTVSGEFNNAEEVPVYTLDLNLVNADFQKLNLSEDPLKVRGGIKLELATADFKVINGDMAIYKVGIFNGTSLYTIDSLLFASVDMEGKSSMSVRSEILDGKFEGTFNLFSIGTVMQQHLNRYFALRKEDITEFTTPQNFTFDLTLKNTDLITEVFIPELEPFVPGKISGAFDSETHALEVDVNFAQIKYGTTAADSVALSISSDEDALTYRFRLKNVLLDTALIDALQLSGRVEDNVIYTAFRILTGENENKFVLGGTIKSQEKNFRFSFLPDQVILNQNAWSVPEDNYLEFSKAGLVAHNFSISRAQEQIGLVTAVKDSTVAIEFQQLRLANITSMISSALPADGILDGDFKFSTASSGNFNSMLEIRRFEVFQKPVGDLTLALAHAGSRYTIDLAIKNQGSNLTANGFYDQKATAIPFNIAVKLAPLNLQVLEAFSFGQLKNVTGNATGAINLSGNFDQPSIRGNLTFSDAAFTSTYLNSAFALKHETISFEESGIGFKSFTISDSKKNTAVIDGSILTKAYKEFRFNLALTTKNFQVLNTTAEDNTLYYGKVSLNAKAKITGNANRPKVDVTIGFSNDTEFTYVVPQTQKSVMEQKGIVEFVDKDAYKDPFLKDIVIEDTTTVSFTGMDISANLELTDRETLNVVIDPITGDKLSIKGNSNLSLTITPSGNMNLSGRYEVTKGTYNFSFYKLLKREFEIVKGGSLTWTGDPMNAQLDLQASHLVETSPIDLISNQINTTDQRYQQRLPFFVYLNIKGQLLAPVISFSLDMPQDKQNAFGGAVYARILDINTRESDVNKQVFALLILRRFISENPLESQAGSDVANATRTSVSRLLSDQLNRLSENVKGVQLNVDVKSYEDYSTGEAQGNTSVQLGVSKSLFNDRLVVKLSGNVDVEGENTNQGNASDYIGDLALEYKLTADGRIRITGFRTSNYDMIDGELAETGVGLIYIKDYNTLKELFKSNTPEK